MGAIFGSVELPYHVQEKSGSISRYVEVFHVISKKNLVRDYGASKERITFTARVRDLDWSKLKELEEQFNNDSYEYFYYIGKQESFWFTAPSLDIDISGGNLGVWDMTLEVIKVGTSATYRWSEEISGLESISNDWGI